VVWFDIDNTLYPESSKISQAMSQRIHGSCMRLLHLSTTPHLGSITFSAYFVTLGLSDDAAADLHLKYYTQYGLALRGLAQHHHIGKLSFEAIVLIHKSNAPHETDPLDFDQKCDGSLPLETMIMPNPPLRKLFQDIDRSKARVWALTNAYLPVRTSCTIQCDVCDTGIL
jgi:pyrimidine and pyridine-specific 5'-nucleotidase